MDDIPVKHRILYLLMNGWTNLSLIAAALEIEEEDVLKAVKELEFDGAIRTHTIH